MAAAPHARCHHFPVVGGCTGAPRASVGGAGGEGGLGGSGAFIWADLFCSRQSSVALSLQNLDRERGIVPISRSAPRRMIETANSAQAADRLPQVVGILACQPAVSPRPSVETSDWELLRGLRSVGTGTRSVRPFNGTSSASARTSTATVGPPGGPARLQPQLQADWIPGGETPVRHPTGRMGRLIPEHDADDGIIKGPRESPPSGRVCGTSERQPARSETLRKLARWLPRSDLYRPARDGRSPCTRQPAGSARRSNTSAGPRSRISPDASYC